MKQEHISIIAFAFAAFVLALLGYFTNSLELRWAIVSGSFGLLGLGLALNSFFLSERTDKRIKEIDISLQRIEGLQQEVHKELTEQVRANSPIANSLQALSQYYIDYLAKHAEKKTSENE